MSLLVIVTPTPSWLLHHSNTEPVTVCSFLPASLCLSISVPVYLSLSFCVCLCLSAISPVGLCVGISPSFSVQACFSAHLSICPSVTMPDVCVCLFLNLFISMFVILPLSFSVSLSPFLPLCLCVSVPALFLSSFVPVSQSLRVSLHLSVCLSLSSKSGVTQPTLPVHYREATEQSSFAHARSSTAGANNEKFRINWVLITCQGKNGEIYIYETKDNLATVKTSAQSNKSHPSEA